MDLVDRINYFQREIRNLKTSHVKTATTIATLEKNATITLPLRLYGSAAQYWEIISSRKAVITLASTDGTDMISALYVNNLTPDNFNNRYVFVRRRGSASGRVIYEIYTYSYNTNDANTLSNGGTINLSYNLTAVASSNFNVLVSYEEFNPWQA